jgi:hypothetical protein
MTPAWLKPSRTSCTAIAAIRKLKTFSVTSMRFLVKLATYCVLPQHSLLVGWSREAVIP